MTQVGHQLPLVDDRFRADPRVGSDDVSERSAVRIGALLVVAAGCAWGRVSIRIGAHSSDAI